MLKNFTKARIHNWVENDEELLSLGNMHLNTTAVEMSMQKIYFEMNNTVLNEDPTKRFKCA